MQFLAEARCRRFRIPTSVRALAAIALAAIGVGASSPAHAQATSYDSTAVVTWTAPGDDGMTGRAARYELRYSNQPIAGTDTLGWWNAAATVNNMPAPSAPGLADSVHVAGLDPAQSWYFVLRTADEVPNWSNFSNVAIRAPYVDRLAPLAITDLRNSATDPPPPAQMNSR